MRTLVIPDIHEQPDRVRYILSKEKYDKVAYLGDWFDSFTSTPDTVKSTVDLLIEELDKPNRVFLFGNHDTQYARKRMECSGFKESTLWATNTVDFSKFIIAASIDGFLLSHAGFRPETAYLIDNVVGMGDYAGCLDMIGTCRGGYDKFGGPTWLDWRHEFKSIPGVKQIVGHTPASYVREIDGNYCLDTHLNHYGIIDKGVFSYYEAT